MCFLFEKFHRICWRLRKFALPHVDFHLKLPFHMLLCRLNLVSLRLSSPFHSLLRYFRFRYILYLQSIFPFNTSFKFQFTFPKYFFPLNTSFKFRFTFSFLYQNYFLLHIPELFIYLFISLQILILFNRFFTNIIPSMAFNFLS